MDARRSIACLAAAGGLDGCADPVVAAPPRRYSATPYVYDRVPRRDERFPDPYNMAVNAEAFVWDESKPAPPKLLMLFYKRLREIDVPEMMASIIAETPDKPWAYYRDMSRQLWDEARHALMGEVGFAALGIDWPSLVRINFTWSLGLNTQLTRDRAARGALLHRAGADAEDRQALRVGGRPAAAGLPLAQTFQDFDWADEVLHARIGRQWYVSAMPSHVEALKYGDRCWSKVLVGLGAVAKRRPHRARELVAAALSRVLCLARRDAGSGGRRLRHQLPGEPGGPERAWRR